MIGFLRVNVCRSGLGIGRCSTARMRTSLLGIYSARRMKSSAIWSFDSETLEDSLEGQPIFVVL